ncbi:hypothetical protein J2T12_002856 [Paenibacillus anaericanus]|nr:hypothetical protein [Paenibacillus anaericanus]
MKILWGNILITLLGLLVVAGILFGVIYFLVKAFKK